MITTAIIVTVILYLLSSAASFILHTSPLGERMLRFWHRGKLKLWAVMRGQGRTGRVGIQTRPRRLHSLCPCMWTFGSNLRLWPSQAGHPVLHGFLQAVLTFIYPVAGRGTASPHLWLGSLSDPLFTFKKEPGLPRLGVQYLDFIFHSGGL